MIPGRGPGRSRTFSKTVMVHILGFIEMFSLYTRINDVLINFNAQELNTGGPRIARFLGERNYRVMRNRVMRGPL